MSSSPSVANKGTAFVLLTGAGFTRNWGGWLAKELEGDLLARLAGDPQLRRLLQLSSNYEEALEKVRAPGYSGMPFTPDQTKEFEGAIKQSFWAMNTALAQRGSMNLSNDNERAVQRFLGRFDAIFTLNQDLLLELYYDPTLYHLGRWNGTCYPGIEPLSAAGMNSGDIVRIERRVGVIGAIDPLLQPIYKLHGSVNWSNGTGTLFVVGGGKESYIRGKPILATYFEELKRQIEQPGARLMIIGYGFADDHVNKLIETAAMQNTSLGVYHVHPAGRDAIYQGARDRGQIQWTPPLADVPCVGESRRLLSSTFSGDQLEYDKLMRFFAH